jgi:hypothetical protein
MTFRSIVVITTPLLLWSVTARAQSTDFENQRHQPSKANRSWWSLQPVEAEIPLPLSNAAEAWNERPIDRFVLAKLRDQDLHLNKPANPRELIRRASFDVTGLPPTPEEIDSFLAAYDEEPERAWVKLVDDLLASPRYGERWGRHWLDVVRFGESNGYERNFIIDTIWPFRDYVIRSFNEDKPFDQFIIEHLAGDVVGKGNPDVEVATAFLVAGPFDDVGNQDPKAAAQIRANHLDEMIRTTSEAFLGLTVGCARCHDHKFDPILQADYYQMRATFEGVTHGERAIATADEHANYERTIKPLEATKEELRKLLLEAEEAIVDNANQHADSSGPALAPKVSPLLTEERFDPVEARFVRLRAFSATGNAKSAGGARVDEFEIWSASKPDKNVAARDGGAKIIAEDSRIAADSNAQSGYQAANALDGNFLTKWLSGAGGTFTIQFAVPETIDRITFSSDRRGDGFDGFANFVAEYVIEASMDGESWKTIADGYRRAPYSTAHQRQRQLVFGGTLEQRSTRDRLIKGTAAVQAKLDAVPKPNIVWAGKFSSVKERTHVFTGGDPQRKGETVTAASISATSDVAPAYALAADAPESERRLALAHWLTHPANPLTPRVLANRIWHYHFGAGLVRSPSDFGYHGGEPSHPELLDYLASRIIASGWRLKSLHREILLTNTYRQASTWRKEASKRDSESRYLWRYPPRRLSAEEIRDTMLAVSGKLDERMGGAGFRLYRFMQDNVATYAPLDKHGPETYRRSVYHQNVRASQVDLMSDFDCPDNAFATPRRASTTTPLQALTMLNHSFPFDMAEGFAKRLTSEADTTSERIVKAYLLAYGRDPMPEELANALVFAKTHGLTSLCRVIFNSSEFIYVK